jgi:hypothetical protein
MWIILAYQVSKAGRSLPGLDIIGDTGYRRVYVADTRRGKGVTGGTSRCRRRYGPDR